MSYKFGSRSIDRMQGVNSDIIKCAELALSNSKYDMTVPWMGGVRTVEEQNAIFLEGNTKCDGYSKKSYHQSGNALDIIPVGSAPYTKTKEFNHFAQRMYESWQKLLVAGEVKGLLCWGGLWGQSGWDKPHWEIRGL